MPKGRGLFAGAVQTTMLTTYPTRLLESFSESLASPVKTDGEIIECDVEIVCHLGRRFALQIDTP
jgi:hypothetical protein